MVLSARGQNVLIEGVVFDANKLEYAEEIGSGDFLASDVGKRYIGLIMISGEAKSVIAGIVANMGWRHHC